MARSLFSAFITLNLSLSLIPLSPPVVLADGPISQESEATVIAISEDKASLTALLPGQPTPASIEVPKDQQPVLKDLQSNDVVALRFVEQNGKKLLSRAVPKRFDVEGEISSLSGDKSALTVIPSGQTGKLTLEVTKEMQGEVTGYQRGDRVTLQYIRLSGKTRLTEIAPQTVEVSGFVRILVLLGVTLGLLAVVAAIIQGNPGQLALGLDNRYSNSQLQVATWFGVLLLAYVSVIALRWKTGGAAFAGGVNIPQNLLALSGLSAFTFAAARGITTQKVEAAQARQPAAAQPVKLNVGQPAFFADLVRNDNGQVDLGDVQMLLVLLLAVVVYLVQVFDFLGSLELLRAVTLPDVDGTLLTAFGVGQGAYLAKKLAGNVRES